MRNATLTELAALAATVRAHHLAVEVEGPDATWVDLTDLLGDDWVVGASWGQTIDEQVADCRVRIRRTRHGGVSLAPLMQGSPANRDGLGQYAPLLDAGREVRILTATVAAGVMPAPGDWRVVFEGVIDRVGWASDPLEITARDPSGGALVDRWVEEETEYGEEGGQPIEEVIQAILNDWAGGITLWSINGTPATPFDPDDAPGFMVNPYRQQKQSVYDALQALAQLIGWVIRYRWNDAAGKHVLTLYEPDRQKTTPDYTFGPDDYDNVTRLDIDRAHVRNAISVIYTDSATGERAKVTAEDANSIARYGRRWMEIEEASDSPIDSDAEAQAMADAALADLRLPAAEQEIETLYFWPVELGDLYAFKANGVHYDTDQQWAVVGYRHELEPGRERTVLTVRGAPAGMYRAWIGRGGEGMPAGEPMLVNFRRVSETATHVTFSWEPNALTHDVWVYTAQREDPPPEDPWPEVDTPPTDIIGRDVTTWTVARPPEGYATYVQLEARDARLRAGSVWRAVVYPPPAGPPVIETDDAETATTGTLWWRIQERGIAVTSMQIVKQVGDSPATLSQTPDRGPGNASTVKGGTLRAGEYEVDVPLALDRLSWITVHLHLASGETTTIGPMAFDRGAAPTLVSVTVNDTKVTVVADSDTAAIGLARIDGGGTWEVLRDGQFHTFDIANVDDNGNPGFGAGAVWTLRATAYSDPIADIGQDTLTDTADVQVRDQSVTDPQWVQVSARAPGPGSAVMEITLAADSAPAGYTVRLFARADAGAGYGPDADITAAVAPSLAGQPPPTTPTKYDYTTDYAKGTTRDAFVQYQVRAEIRNSSNIVVASQTATAGWYYNAGPSS